MLIKSIILKINSQKELVFFDSLESYWYFSKALSGDHRIHINHISGKYNDISDIETSLEQGFKHYLYYFPDKPVPKIATYISGFNYAIITTDSILGIGLDMYLGSNSNFYKIWSYSFFANFKKSNFNYLLDKKQKYK